MPSFRIVADDAVPLVHELFGSFGEIELIPGEYISRRDVVQADVLLVRSVTRVDAGLLDGSRVGFVGSATAGMDHVDRGYLERSGITCAHASGSNAVSVVEYVITALLRLSARRSETLRGKTVGIVGFGHVGSRLAERVLHLGCQTLLCDPPLADEAERAGAAHDYRPVEELLAVADVVSLHVPLVHDGECPTFHMIDAERLAGMKPGAWLIDTSRGGVVDHEALRNALACGAAAPGAIVLDVWEHEPVPDPWLLARADLATPHVAGYSRDAKTAGSVMLFQAFVRYLNELPSRGGPPPPAKREVKRVLGEFSGSAGTDLPLTSPDPALPEIDWLDALVSQMYDVAGDTARMKAALSDDAAAVFHTLRRTYSWRRAFSAYTIRRELVPPRFHEPAMKALGIRLATYG